MPKGPVGPCTLYLKRNDNQIKSKKYDSFVDAEFKMTKLGNMMHWVAGAIYDQNAQRCDSFTKPGFNHELD